MVWCRGIKSLYIHFLAKRGFVPDSLRVHVSVLLVAVVVGFVLEQQVDAAVLQDPGRTLTVDSELPELAIVRQVRIDEGGGAAVFVVTLSRSAALDVTVSYVTLNGTATAGEDYEAVSGVLRIAAGATSGRIVVPILEDHVVERAETFTVVLSGVTNAVLGHGTSTGTIEDNDGDTLLRESGSRVVEMGDNAAEEPFSLGEHSEWKGYL